MDLIIKKIKMKIDKISYLQCELKNYEILSKDDILTLLQNYEKTTRDEMSSCFKNFQKEENKWDYFMKIAKMTPKKIAEINFLAILNEYIEEVPDEYKQEIIDFLQEKYQMANNEGGKKYYQDMINRINFNF